MVLLAGDVGAVVGVGNPRRPVAGGTGQVVAQPGAARRIASTGVGKGGLHDEITRVLSEVGLEGMEDRDTSTLSGGELQRLAVANSLLRKATVLLADEATAMLDPRGRAQVSDLLHDLSDRGTAVVQSTHRPEDTARGSTILTLGPTPAAVRDPVPAVPPSQARGEPVLVAHDVSHTHDAGSPWARPALHGVSLVLREGEMVLVKGSNGSGKTTLAWILAGLIRPTGGRVTLAGTELDGPRAQIGIAFQHPRLQMMRPTVRAEVAASSGDEDQVDDALDLMGLDPARFGDRLVDTLSGGEQRRVGLARVMLARPQLLVADEPTSGLDAAVKASMVALLLERVGPSCSVVLVSHDLSTLAKVCDRVVVIDGGQVVERLVTSALETQGWRPSHPCTAALLEAAGWTPPERTGP